MDRCVVLVDAGYLMGAAATLLAHNGLRSSVTADYGPMLASIVEEAQLQTGLPVLRVMWYDAAPEARPTQTHLTLGTLPDVKVRLGVLVRHGARTEQKGVDALLQRDMTTLARNNAVADVVLIGGDEDLRRAVVETQDYGVKVHLWGVWAAAPRFNQAPTLVAEADRRWVLSEAWVRRHIRLRPGALSVEEAVALFAASSGPAPADADALADALARPPSEPAPTTGGPDPSPPTLGAPALGDAAAERGATSAPPPSPDDPVQPVPIRRIPGRDRPLSTEPGTAPSSRSFEHVTPAIMTQFAPPVPAPQPGGGSPHPETPVPTLAELTSQRQSWQDNEEDTTTALVGPDAVGARYARRWVDRASAAHRRALLALYPKLPRSIDGEVLRFAFTRGVDTWEDEAAKFAVRGAVWRTVAESESDTEPDPPPEPPAEPRPGPALPDPTDVLPPEGEPAGPA